MLAQGRGWSGCLEVRMGIFFFFLSPTSTRLVQLVYLTLCGIFFFFFGQQTKVR